MNFIQAIQFIILISTIQAFIHLTPKEEPTGIIFSELAEVHVSYNEWRILYYYELGNYYEEIEKLRNCTRFMASLCENMQDNTTCIAITEEHIDREKRALLEFWGKVDNILFGLMDAEHARVYDKKINELQNATTNHNEIMQEQLLLVKNVIVTNEKTFDVFKKALIGLQNEMNSVKTQIGSTVNDLVLHNKFQDISQIATLIIIDLNRQIKALLNLLQNSLTGKITNLIPPKKLEKDLLD